MGEAGTAMALSGVASKVGQKLGFGSGGGAAGIDVQGGVEQANNILKKSLQQALGYSENYTNKGVGTQEDYYGKTVGFLQDFLNKATQQATTNTQEGLKQSIATNAPVVQAGYEAMDKYKDSLGMARAAMGTGALAQAIQNNPHFLDNIQSLQSSYGTTKQLAESKKSSAGYTDKLTKYVSGKYDVGNLITGDAFASENLGKTLTGPTAAETDADVRSKFSRTDTKNYLTDVLKDSGYTDSYLNFIGSQPSYRTYLNAALDGTTKYYDPKLGNSLDVLAKDSEIGNIQTGLRNKRLFIDSTGQVVSHDEYVNPKGPMKSWLANNANSANQLITDIQNTMIGNQVNRANAAYNTSNTDFQNIQNNYNAYNQAYSLLGNQLQGMSGYTAAQLLAAQQGIFGQARII
jgi:hypothetical protein